MTRTKIIDTKQKATYSKNFYMYLLLAPALIAVTIFAYLPFLGLIMAFQDFDIIKGFTGSEWVGFDNFIEVLSTPQLLDAIWNTLKYGCVLTFVSFPFPIVLAVLINEIRSSAFKKLTQTITYLPHFLSWITVVGLFYAALSSNGTVNNLMAAIFGEGYERKNILLDSNYFLGVIFTAQLWKELGWSSIIFLAAIVGIDQSLYEAASIDGCGRVKQIWYITIPSIMSTVIIILVMKLGTIFNTSFELIHGFQNVYTQPDTDVISTVIYRQGIQGGEYSLSTAFGLMQGLVSVILVFSANAISKKLANVSIW